MDCKSSCHENQQISYPSPNTLSQFCPAGRSNFRSVTTIHTIKLQRSKPERNTKNEAKKTIANLSPSQCDSGKLITVQQINPSWKTPGRDATFPRRITTEKRSDGIHMVATSSGVFCYCVPCVRSISRTNKQQHPEKQSWSVFVRSYTFSVWQFGAEVWTVASDGLILNVLDWFYMICSRWNRIEKKSYINVTLAGIIFEV